MERFRPEIANYLTRALNDLGSPSVTGTEIENPPDRKLGDFAFPCFKFAKQAKKSPAVFATELCERVLKILPLERFSAAPVGPYVNFTIQKQTLIQAIFKDLLSENSAEPYGALPANTRAKWVFEFSSPNVAKPFQIYHLRTTIVGAALSRIAKLRGYQVTTINHLGDWGTQYGKLAVAFERYKNDLPQDLSLNDLVQIYIKIHQDIEKEPALESECQEAFRRLESGDPAMRAFWKRCIEISLKEFKKVYENFQVSFDFYWGESHYENQLKPLTQKLVEQNLLIEDQGAKIVRVVSRSGQEIPPCIIEKSDGASIYATRDLAAAIYRYDQFHFDRMSYVVGKEQMLHFEQVFGVLRAMEFKWEKDCEHIATGLYRFKDSKMSTRKGNFVTLEEVLHLCNEKALRLMHERKSAQAQEDESISNSTPLEDAEILKIAEQVATGAIVFADLSTDPTRDLEFDVDRVISFEGETGPYLQYAHTRCKSILRKAELQGFVHPERQAIEESSGLDTPEEIFLLKTLGKFPSTLERTLDQRKPSQLATYLIDLAHDFGTFYRERKVINPESPALTRARLGLVECTRRVLALGLDLLGIPKPEKM